MTWSRLVWRSLWFHWRGNLAVLLGVAVGTAVLTGALLVGDSLRGSLRALADQQLADVEYAVVASRFFREALADELAAERVCPILLLRGSVSVGSARGSSDEVPGRRVNRVSILGIDQRFWPMANWPVTPLPRAAEPAYLNATLARRLQVVPDEEITLHVPKTGSVPRETLLGRRDVSEVMERITLTVEDLIGDEYPGAAFRLHPSPEAPLNVFVPLTLLQEKLGIPGKVNALLLVSDPASSEALDLRGRLTLEDWGLELRTAQSRADALLAKFDRRGAGALRRLDWQGRLAESMVRLADTNGDGILSREELLGYFGRQRGYLSLESRQMILEPAVAAALAAAHEVGLRAAPTLVYLANSISDGSAAIPYSVVAALDPAAPPPLGPFLPEGRRQLRDDEILLVDWPESPLRAEPGATITLAYFPPEQHGRFEERTARFRLAGRLPLAGVALDPDLTPEFPGITDKLTLAAWDPPFPFDGKRVRRPDEDYWKEYRTTPKAYVTLRAGQALWGSRFGNLTSIRLAPPEPAGARAADWARRFEEALLRRLSPEDGGFVLEPISQRAAEASVGGTDFGGLFLGFSSFLIVSALLLVGLLMRLNLDRRAEEIGALLAMGYRRTAVRRLWLAEGALLAVGGSGLGLVGAVGYAYLMLEYLLASWPGTLAASFLRLHVPVLTLGIGFGAGLLMSILTIAWATRLLGRVPPRALLAGETTASAGLGRPAGWPSRCLAWGASMIGLALLLGGGWFVAQHELQALTFFGGGALVLVGALAWVWIGLHHDAGALRSLAGLGVS
ncbi:MAG: ABC transporter permease, partial [Gemmataceae bacterium]|nr:ABC transporter permease [Gemmataceae bacterium]MDW8264131.1 ABC transporter permease [Gemmataceae bacterium]